MRKFQLISIFVFFIFIKQTAFCKIYDCFLFFNEEELLKIHLEELYDKVDYFVIVEGSETFSGRAKEYLFPKIQNQYRKYIDKIIYVQVDEKYPGDNPWPREYFQRNQIMRGLENCQPDDIIIIGDLDEIVKARCLDDIIDKLQYEEFVRCDCDFYRWFLNRKDLTTWIGSTITTYAFLKQYSPQKMRELMPSIPFKKGAWHFSNMGGLKTFIEKIRSFSHYKECVNEGHDVDDLYLRIQNFQLVEIDESFPKYIQENIQYYRDLNFIDNENGHYY